MEEKILVLDFGGQYNQLIARRVREQRVYAEIRAYNRITPQEIQAAGYKGIIFTGGPNSVYLDDSPHVDPAVFKLGIPVLGICYGCQLMAHTLGGLVTAAQDDSAREYGKTETCYDTSCALFKGLPQQGISWMSHGDYMAKVPEGFALVGHTKACPNVAIADEKRGFYGVQFHPEVNHTQYGADMIRNFLYEVCHVKGEWTMDDFCQRTVTQLRQKIGQGRVLLALSGGVDSSVLAALLAEAVGDQLTAVFVDHGCMRKNEGDEVESAFAKWNIHFVRVNAQERFLNKLKGVTDPQAKRRIIGAEFGYVFLDEALKFGITKEDFFAQGTIYPDVIESGAGDADVIKSHHNKLLPKEVVEQFQEVLEPLDHLFKDEIRQLGRELGLPEYLVSRQPFPGPGLAIRILGDVTREKLDILREADAIFREEIANSGCTDICSQYFAVLTNAKSVGVMGDGRTYENTLVLRSVTTDDFMTAEWTRIPYDVLDRVSVRIVNEVPHINRIVYDITSKPPATVEWE
ncbi:MAG: glutamine-hydrolyzing GMP synthase [Eubacteriales bacterium]|nr:glutamine-hydrolyzing GMP synthase [Eubacteriales bacterium]